jgi:itaconate CoA-transferase
VQPLTGVTVVSLEQAVAAPFATRQLADLGARVIKVERVGTGDFARQYDEALAGMASYFVWLNRSKESIAVDVKSAEGRQVLARLVERADVIVHNVGPGAAGRLGLDAETVRDRDPSKVVLAITGWGSNGPWASRKAYDLLVQCEAGLVSLTGTADERARVGVSIADIAAGMYGFTAVLAALYQRQASGEGATLEVSLFEALAEWMGQPALYTAGSGKPPLRAGVEHPTIAPYGAFTCRDGHITLMAIQNEIEWATFCKAFLGDVDVAVDPRFVTNTLRVANRQALNQTVAERFAQLDGPEATALLDEAGIANAGVNDMDQFLNHPVLRDRGRWRPVQTPVGPVDLLVSPIDLHASDARMDPVPALGQHTRCVLGELGYSASAVEQLLADGVAESDDGPSTTREGRS